MIPIKDVIQMASDAGAEMGKMEGIEFAIAMTPEQLYTMCDLIFKMGKVVSDDQVKEMVNRFLGWKLPKDFAPDAGISFKADYNECTPRPAKQEPMGTNLFHAGQAEEMVRHMLG